MNGLDLFMRFGVMAQVENGTLTLYDAGNEYSEVTGGYETYQSHDTYKVTKEAASLKVTHTSGYSPACFFDTANAIDLTNYTTLKFNCNFTNIYSVRLGATTTKMTSWTTSASAYVDTTTTGAQTVSVDVSALNGSYYVFGRFGAGESIGTNGNITKIWLE